MMNMKMGVKPGSRVKVKNGVAHDEMTKGKSGVVKTIGTHALGIKFDDMSGIHKWYVESELKKTAKFPAKGRGRAQAEALER